MASYPEVGDTETLTLAVNDATGAPIDPATLTLTIDAPSGARITETWPSPPSPAIVRASAGRFSRILPYTEAGTWRYRWSTTNPTEGEGERITVRSTTLDALPRSLSLEQLKRRLDRTTTIDEDLLADDLAAAYLQAQSPPPYGCGRLLSPDPAVDTDPVVTRTLTSTRRRVQIPDAREITAVTVDAVAATAYTTITKDGLIVQLDLADDGRWTERPAYYDWQEGRPFLRRAVVVTGRFGFATIPDDLAGAIYVLAARWHYERAAQFADQVAILEGSAVQSYFRQLPPRVKLTFAHYSIPAAIGGLR